MSDRIVLHPIGYVACHDDESVIEVSGEFEEALEGMENQEYIWVLFWMHRLSPEDRRLLRTHPMGDRSRPKRGVFALRSPCRPTPIGLTRVRLLSRRGNRLTVADLDALDGSPVIDIKSG